MKLPLIAALCVATVLHAQTFDEKIDPHHAKH